MRMQFATLHTTIEACVDPEANGELQEKWMMDVDCQCCSSNGFFLLSWLFVIINSCAFIAIVFVVKIIKHNCHHHCCA